MPVYLTHPQYSAAEAKWERSRDCISGTDCVKEKTTKYLPQLSGQSKPEYDAYLSRALFVGVANRTRQGLSGIITRRQPKLEYPPEMEQYFVDVDNNGMSFQELFKQAVDEVLLTARFMTLIDYPVEGGRGFILPYLAEEMINWGIDNDFHRLNMAVLKESIYENVGEDIFSMTKLLEYRTLYLDENGYYTGEVWRQGNADGTMPNISTAVERKSIVRPTIRGEPLEYIPITVFTPVGVSYDIHKPPLLDIVDVNLSHYRTSADLEHGRHFTALPTPVVSGVDSETELRIGSNKAWILPDSNAKAYYLEYTGQGLKSLEQALKEKMEQMAIFSTRLMDTSTRGSEAVDTVRIRQASDAATLTDIAEAVESGLNRTYKMLAELEGYDPNEVNIELNKYFMEPRLTGAELRELVKGYMEGAVDERTFYYNLERGDMSPPDDFQR